MIDIHLLRYALAAADTGSFRQAANQFRIKQSTLSKHILYLEQRLGLSIFARSTRGVVPTEPGISFLERARMIVDEVEALGRDTSNIARGQRDTLRIGLGYPLATSELSPALRSYTKAYPERPIEATEQSRGMLLRGLSTGRIDVAVFPGLSPTPDIRSFSFWSEQISVAIAADHPLAAQDRVYWTDLRTCTFLVTAADPGPDIAQMIRARLSAPGHEPRLETQAVGPESLFPLVSGNRVAVTFGTRQRSVAGDATIFRSPHDAFGPTRLEQSVHWRPGNRSPALATFLGHLAQRFGCAPHETRCEASSDQAVAGR
jgi:DNA-binding transcriptional LysR family regulator